VAAGLFVGGWRLAARAAAPEETTGGEKKEAELAQGSDMAQLLRLEELTLEIGFQLIPLVDEKRGGQLLNRVRALRCLTDSVRLLIGSASAAALPVLLCPSPARYHVKRWLEPVLPRVAVVAASEIPPEIRLRPVGTVR